VPAPKVNAGFCEELLQSGDELAAEDSTQGVNGQKETPRGIDPSGRIESQTTGGNDVMDMGMMLKVLTPGVEHAEESDVGSQVLGIASQFEHRRGTSAVEQIVDQPLVLQCKGREFMRQREHNVEVRNGQQFSRTRREPFCARSPGTWGSAGCGRS
jgi:hypothetical protein